MTVRTPSSWLRRHARCPSRGGRRRRRPVRLFLRRHGGRIHHPSAQDLEVPDRHAPPRPADRPVRDGRGDELRGLGQLPPPPEAQAEALCPGQPDLFHRRPGLVLAARERTGRPIGVPIVFWFWAEMFLAVSVIQFWILVNDCFSPRRVKRFIGLFIGGGLLGGIAGSVLTRFVPTPFLLISLHRLPLHRPLDPALLPGRPARGRPAPALRR